MDEQRKFYTEGDASGALPGADGTSSHGARATGEPISPSPELDDLQPPPDALPENVILNKDEDDPYD